ncbi:MAG: hypothetical protein ACRELY_15025 [Polyangiaceae bacterium]
MSWILFSLLAPLVFVACASNPPPPAAAPAPASSTQTTTTAASEDPPTSVLHRADVHRVVSKGLGAFLTRLTLDDQPAMNKDGKFVGFRIAALQGDGWRGVDLKPGDVVTKVNGFSIERPEQALEAFQSLDVASELRVDLQRDGAPHELRYAIVDP